MTSLYHVDFWEIILEYPWVFVLDVSGTQPVGLEGTQKLCQPLAPASHTTQLFKMAESVNYEAVKILSRVATL